PHEFEALQLPQALHHRVHERRVPHVLGEVRRELHSVVTLISMYAPVPVNRMGKRCVLPLIVTTASSRSNAFKSSIALRTDSLSATRPASVWEVPIRASMFRTA